MKQKRNLILVVDDEPHILKAVHYILDRAGYQVLAARDAEEALSLVSRDRPSLVVADIMLPGMDGYKLCRRLRHSHPDSLTPFIFLSARDSVDDRVKGIRTGADAYLTKPFHREELLAMVEAVLDRHQSYAEQIMNDDLTGLLNRSHILQRLEEEFARARRYRRPLAAAMIDLDNFKAVNDLCGHPAGDRLLRQIAQLLRGEMRKQDFLGRYGGEEFLSVLPETTAADGAILLERCRKKVAEITARRGKNSEGIPVTLSAGVTELAGGDKNLSELLDRADCLLYRAKEEGRDRVAVR
ncbi:MAG: diguanylate cyclase [Candidatus Erginobacter occultus]|nr:diguanylate cyclase [Candidatus Erginobacter occultus]